MSFGTLFILNGLLLFRAVPLAIVLLRKKFVGIGVLLVLLSSWVGLVVHLILTSGSRPVLR